MIVQKNIPAKLWGRIVRLELKDANPSLTFKISIPVLFQDMESTLSADLRYPQVRSWRELIGKKYLFDGSTRRYDKSDGETYAKDDVYGDLRTEKSWFDTRINIVEFGKLKDESLHVVIKGTVDLNKNPLPFSVNAYVHIEGVELLDGSAAFASSILNMNDYTITETSEDPAIIMARFL